jgi:hypothetical protein
LLEAIDALADRGFDFTLRSQLHLNCQSAKANSLVFAWGSSIVHVETSDD